MQFSKKAFLKPLLILLLLVWVTHSSAHIHGIDVDHDAQCTLVHFVEDDHASPDLNTEFQTSIEPYQELFNYVNKDKVSVNYHFLPSRAPPVTF